MPSGATLRCGNGWYAEGDVAEPSRKQQPEHDEGHHSADLDRYRRIPHDEPRHAGKECTEPTGPTGRAAKQQPRGKKELGQREDEDPELGCAAAQTAQHDLRGEPSLRAGSCEPRCGR